jgi:hypothetical protein
LASDKWVEGVTGETHALERWRQMTSERSMKMRALVIAIFLGTLSTAAHAVRIGPFPGLDRLIEQADVVAIVRSDEHIQPAQDSNLMTRHRCYVYQTLKGDLPAAGRVVLNLRDTRSTFVSPFSFLSTHLVFLVRVGDGYENRAFKGSILRLSPFGNEKVPEGPTHQTQIGNLVTQSIAYWDREWNSERAFLEEATK